jgi:hypothetical protein
MSPPTPATAGVPAGEPAARLLLLWSELAQQSATAAAHRRSDGHGLRELQRLVEDAIFDAAPDHNRVLAEMCRWEIDLMHDSDKPANECSVCEGARAIGAMQLIDLAVASRPDRRTIWRGGRRSGRTGLR